MSAGVSSAGLVSTASGAATGSVGATTGVGVGSSDISSPFHCNTYILGSSIKWSMTSVDTSQYSKYMLQRCFGQQRMRPGNVSCPAQIAPNQNAWMALTLAG